MIHIINFKKEANLRFLGLFVWLGFIYREVGRGRVVKHYAAAFAQHFQENWAVLGVSWGSWGTRNNFNTLKCSQKHTPVTRNYWQTIMK